MWRSKSMLDATYSLKRFCRLRITADKKEIEDFPKLPSANFFYPQNVRRNLVRYEYRER